MPRRHGRLALSKGFCFSKTFSGQFGWFAAWLATHDSRLMARGKADRGGQGRKERPETRGRAAGFSEIQFPSFFAHKTLIFLDRA
jgi:hypothetical protein